MFKSLKYKLKFLKILNSPFVGLKLKWYFGEIQHGTPYFLPRKWVKTKKGFRSPIQVKYLWFDFITLGWKTKWNEYRFEHSPMISIVLFGKQICIWFMPNIDLDEYRIALDCYWEAWLNYEYDTDKTKSIEERLKELFSKYSCTWGNSEKGYTDYYPIILKKKYYE